MATIAPSGAGDQPAVDNFQGATILNGGNLQPDSFITNNIPLSELADDQGQPFGSKVIASVDGGEYSDRVGISGASPEGVVDGETELGYQADNQEWVMNGGNVTETLAGKPYDGLAGGAAGPDATRHSPYLLESTRSYGDVDIDVYAMPSSGFNAWVARSGDGELIRFIDPTVASGTTPSEDSSSKMPGTITYMVGGAVPTNDKYKRTDIAEQGSGNIPVPPPSNDSVPVEVPVGMPIPVPAEFDIRRNGDEYFLENYDCRAHANVPILYPDLYVNEQTGDDANDGLTELTPLKTLSAAQAIGNGAGASRIFLARGSTWQKNQRTTNIGFDCEVIAYGDPQLEMPRITAMVNNQMGAFTSASNHYEGQAGEFISVVRDLTFDDGAGGYLGMIKASSIAEVDSTPNSWYLDWAGNDGPAQRLYIRLWDDRDPEGDPNLELHDSIALRSDGTNITVYYKNIWVDRKLDARGTGPGLRVFMDDCRSSYQSWGCEIFVVNGGKIWAYGGDGNNIDDRSGVSTNCYEIGVDATNFSSGDTSSQASTTHNTSNAVRIGGEYYETAGQNIGDVNVGGATWMMGCTFRDSVTGVSVFTDVPMWIERCTFGNDTPTSLQITGTATVYYLDNNGLVDPDNIDNNGVYTPYL